MVRKIIKTFFIIIVEVFKTSRFKGLLRGFRRFLVARTQKDQNQWFMTWFPHEAVSTRKFARVKVKNEVIIKKVTGGFESELGSIQVMLKDGLMLDFSRGGAKILAKNLDLKAKDSVNLMYKNKNGSWVSVESQVRWTQARGGGEVLMGVQFIGS